VYNKGEKVHKNTYITTINKYSLLFTTLFGNFIALKKEMDPKKLSSVGNTYIILQK